MPENEVKQQLITREQMFSFMEMEDGTLKLIGEGFTDFSESKGPKEYTRKYVNHKTEITDVIGFSPSYSYTCDIISGDPVVEEIIKISDNELTGTAAHRNIITVNGWVPGTSVGTFEAYKRKFAVVPDGKGSGTEALICSGTLKARGDLIKGSFNAETNTFTPDSASE